MAGTKKGVAGGCAKGCEAAAEESAKGCGAAAAGGPMEGCGAVVAGGATKGRKAVVAGGDAGDAEFGRERAPAREDAPGCASAPASGHAPAATPRVFGYARVSTADQNLDRQLDALAEAGVEPSCIYADKASGRDFDRPEWARLMGELSEGDVLMVESIDRLGRDYNDIIEQWRYVTKELRAHVVVLDMPLLDTRRERGDITGAFVADLVLQILSYVAQVERENIRRRQAEGIRAAKARGAQLGRPPKSRPGNYRAVRAAYLAGDVTKGEAAARLGCGKSTFDKWLREDQGAEIDAGAARIGAASAETDAGGAGALVAGAGREEGPAGVGNGGVGAEGLADGGVGTSRIRAAAPGPSDAYGLAPRAKINEIRPCNRAAHVSAHAVREAEDVALSRAKDRRCPSIRQHKRR